MTIEQRRKQIEAATAGAYPPDTPATTWSPEMFDRLFFGSKRCVHFVGFKGDEYVSAVRVFGKPDFIHRKNDLRLVFGGELAPHDTVVYANGSEKAVCLFSVDDSNIDVQAFDKAEREALTK